MENSVGPLGTLWVGLGLGAFYLALTWINVLLGNFLSPLFLIPLTWLQDAVSGRNRPADRTPDGLRAGRQPAPQLGDGRTAR